MSLDSLQSLFQEELKDIYHGEKQLLEALPRMAKAAATPELEQAFTSHLKETEGTSSVWNVSSGSGKPDNGAPRAPVRSLLPSGTLLTWGI